MIKRKLGWMLLGVTSLACSGRFEVGDMNATAGVGGRGGVAGSAATGGELTGPTAGSAPMQGDGTPDGIDADCLTADAPAPLTGPFAEPAVVWRRVAMLTGGEDATPPELPEETTYEWASGLVTQAIVDSHLATGTAPGVETFLRQWLGLGSNATFDAKWGALVPVPRPALEVLLLTTPKPNRNGIFTEPSFLIHYPSISSRGATMEGALFGVVPPAPPAGLDNPEPDTTVSDRESIERATLAAPCTACHRIFDPSGFTLGHFAADGSYRESDHGVIDTTGSRYINSGNDVVEFDGIADFGQKFADSCPATLGFSDAFLRAALALNGASPGNSDELFQSSRERVQQAFVNGGRTYIALVTAYIQSPAGLRP